MKTFEVVRKTDGVSVHIYSANDRVEWDGMGFSIYDHNELINKSSLPAPVLHIEPHSNLIDIGPFFDRFGSSKMAILTSTDLVVQAILTDVSVRKWVDLSLPEIITAMTILSMKISSVTQDIKNNVLRIPVLPEENFALRKLYFS